MLRFRSRSQLVLRCGLKSVAADAARRGMSTAYPVIFATRRLQIIERVIVMIQKIAARKACLVLAILLVVSVVASGCGQSNTIKVPKGEPRCALLSDYQLELVDGLIKDFIPWYNSIDPTKTQVYDEFSNVQYDKAAVSYKALFKTIEGCTPDDHDEVDAVFKATNPMFYVADMMMNEIEYSSSSDSEDMTFEIPEESWQEVHDALVEAIEYFY